MKKLLYSLMMGAIALTGCTTWDDPKTENYGDAPTIEVSIAAVAPTDSAFVVSIVPGAGTTYYAFVMDANDEAEELDASTLLKGGYGNSVVNTSKYPTLTIPVSGMEPNTTYQVYAVASNDKGLVGKIAVASIKTTDSGKPTFVEFTADASAKTATVTFNQAIAPGEGKVSGIYYKEWDWDNPVALTEEDIDVTISGKTATFTTANVPAGAYVLISWEEGAFIDVVGNKCAAFTSTYNESTDKFTGVNFRAKTVSWDINDSYVAPATGASIGDWETFKGTITMPMDIYSVAEDVKDGDLKVTYTNESRTVSYNLKAANWSASEKTITFSLPVEPIVGDIIYVTVKEGIVYDVYGNTNNSYSSEKVVWKYVGFIPTKEDLLGQFSLFLTIQGTAYNYGVVTSTEDPEKENTITLKDFYLEGAEISATYKLDECKVHLPHLEYLGTDEYQGTTYYIFTYDQSGNKDIVFDINSDGTLTSTSIGFVASPDMQNLYGWDMPSETKLEPYKESSQSARKAALKTRKGGKLGKKLSYKLNK